MTPQPGVLRELTASDVRDFTFASKAEAPVWADWDGAKLSTPLFHDIMEPAEDMDGAKVLAVYSSSYYKGKAALIENRRGKGRTLHLGSTFSRDNVKMLLEYTGILEPFAGIVEAPEGVEIVQRTKDGKKYIFVLNFQPMPQKILFKTELRFLYDNTRVTGEIELGAFETGVYEVL